MNTTIKILICLLVLKHRLQFVGFSLQVFAENVWTDVLDFADEDFLWPQAPRTSCEHIIISVSLLRKVLQSVHIITEALLHEQFMCQMSHKSRYLNEPVGAGSEVLITLCAF